MTDAVHIRIYKQDDDDQNYKKKYYFNININFIINRIKFNIFNIILHPDSIDLCEILVQH